MTSILDVALHAAQLKRIPRTGWQIRGAPSGGQPENVAAHSYGVVFLTMLLLDLDDRPLDHGLALRLAILHDLAESLVGDLPVTVSRFIPPELKHTAERAAIAEIVESLPMAARYIDIWECYDEGSQPEAQIVKDADKLDMMIQAYMYEQAGQRNLDEFWAVISNDSFYTSAARTLFEELLRRRQALT